MEFAYYTLDEASVMLRLSKKTITKRIKEGAIPKAVFSGKVLIPASFFKEALGKK